MLCKILLLACLLVVFFDLVQSTRNINTVEDCPNKGNAEYGNWRIDQKDGVKRCVLRCNGGFESSGCHVLRATDENDGWNNDVPTCIKEKWISVGTVGKADEAVVAGAGAVAAAPVVLSGLQGSKPVIMAACYSATQKTMTLGLIATLHGVIFGGISLFGPTCESE